MLLLCFAAFRAAAASKWRNWMSRAAEIPGLPVVTIRTAGPIPTSVPIPRRMPFAGRRQFVAPANPLQTDEGRTMSGKRWAFAVLMLISLVPDSADACLFCPGRRRLFDRCGVCAAPCGAPCCAPMLPPTPCFTPCPPPQPCLVPQQVTTFRDVPQTCLRQEPICVTVPVQTTRQVTEQVWVPQLVTRTVPQTVYQQQIAYRNVPVTTTTRVPVTETRLVPMMPGCAAPLAPSCAAPFSTDAIVPGEIPPLAPATPTPYGMPAIPGTTTVPSTPALPTLGVPSAMYNPPTGSAQLVPVPTAQDPVAPRTSSEEWSSIERRAAFFQQEFGYRPFGNKVQQAGFNSR
jgi:hypothetical protein